MKRVLIIDPGIRFTRAKLGMLDIGAYFPRGAMSIVTFLRTCSIPTDFLFFDSFTPEKSFFENMRLIYRTLEETLKGKDYPLVAIGGPFTLQYPMAKMIAEMVRELSPRSHISLGGIHVTYLDEQSLHETIAVDSIVRGEGEWTVCELAKKIFHGLSLENVRGITYRDGKTVRRNELREPGDISELPILDYGLIPAELYRKDIVNLPASRGCAFNCTFCIESRFWGNKVRMIPVERLLEEMQRISRLVDTPIFSVEDSMFSMKSAYFREFCDGLRSLPKRNFVICHIMTRIDTVEEQGLKLINELGIGRLCFGVESFSEKVLTAMNKKITPNQIKKSLMLARDQGVLIVTLWILGHPGDTPEEAQITLEAIEDFYKRDIHQISTLSMFMPYPGTPIFNNPEAFGMKIHKNEWDKWDRLILDRACELEDFPSEKIKSAYLKYLEIKRTNESSAMLRYALHHKHETFGNFRILLLDMDLGANIISPELISTFWESVDAGPGKGIVGVFFTSCNLYLKIKPYNEENIALLDDMVHLLMTHLGGRLSSYPSSIFLEEMNSEGKRCVELYILLKKLLGAFLAGR